MDKDNADLRYKYKWFEKGADRHLYDAAPRQIKYIIGNKFILEGDEINPNNEPYEQEANEKGETEIRWIMMMMIDNLMEDGREQ